ncbi:PEP-CTERM sorting domain-containing protein [Planctomycetaceae bacterium SH139]
MINEQIDNTRPYISWCLAIILGLLIAPPVAADFLVIDDFIDDAPPSEFGFELYRTTEDLLGTMAYGDENFGPGLFLFHDAGEIARLTYGQMNSHDFGNKTEFVLTGYAGNPEIQTTAYVNGELATTGVITETDFGSEIVFDLAGWVSSVEQLRIEFSATNKFVAVPANGFIARSSLTAIPEPTSLALIGLIGAGAGVLRWRRMTGTNNNKQLDKDAKL